MREYIRVICPRCGEGLDIPVEVEQILSLKSVGHTIVHFETQTVDHKCKE